MSEKLYVERPLFPMAGIAVSVFTIAFGLAMAKSPGVFFFLGGLLNPAILYRAFLIPLMVRLVNLSDTLALSVETRGFTTEAAPYTVYRPVYLQAKDGAFAAWAGAQAAAAF